MRARQLRRSRAPSLGPSLHGKWVGGALEGGQGRAAPMIKGLETRTFEARQGWLVIYAFISGPASDPPHPTTQQLRLTAQAWTPHRALGGWGGRQGFPEG